MDESTFNNLFGHMQALEVLLLATIRALPVDQRQEVLAAFVLDAEEERARWLAGALNEPAFQAMDEKLDMLRERLERY